MNPAPVSLSHFTDIYVLRGASDRSKLDHVFRRQGIPTPPSKTDDKSRRVWVQEGIVRVEGYGGANLALTPALAIELGSHLSVAGFAALVVADGDTKGACVRSQDRDQREP